MCCTLFQQGKTPQVINLPPCVKPDCYCSVQCPVKSAMLQRLRHLQSCKPVPLYASCMSHVAGMVTTLERKQKIYQICSEHDIVIIEDDPYYYLQYSLGTGWPIISISPCSAYAISMHVHVHQPQLFMCACTCFQPCCCQCTILHDGILRISKLQSLLQLQLSLSSSQRGHRSLMQRFVCTEHCKFMH